MRCSRRTASATRNVPEPRVNESIVLDHLIILDMTGNVKSQAYKACCFLYALSESIRIFQIVHWRMWSRWPSSRSKILTNAFTCVGTHQCWKGRFFARPSRPMERLRRVQTSLCLTTSLTTTPTWKSGRLRRTMTSLLPQASGRNCSEC